MEKIRILVWDLPVRVFHWLLAISFAGAFVTAESERFRDVHVALGYTVLGLLAFRIVWAFIGSRYARLASFAYGPRAVLAYLRSLLALRPLHYVGHNPAGSWVIYLLIALGLVTGATGYATYNDVSGHWLEELHEGTANLMLALVFVHVAGVLVSSFLHRENLAKAMVTGYKSGEPRQAIRSARWVTGVTLVAIVAALWSGAIEVPGLAPTQLAKEPAARHVERAQVRRPAAEHGG
ncbi:MAG TPA: cytochrome b/b6 domain-containing protein [Casimicrobiaceae bacterium]